MCVHARRTGVTQLTGCMPRSPRTKSVAIDISTLYELPPPQLSHYRGIMTKRTLDMALGTIVTMYTPRKQPLLIYLQNLERLQQTGTWFIQTLLLFQQRAYMTLIIVTVLGLVCGF